MKKKQKVLKYDLPKPVMSNLTNWEKNFITSINKQKHPLTPKQLDCYNLIKDKYYEIRNGILFLKPKEMSPVQTINSKSVRRTRAIARNIGIDINNIPHPSHSTSTRDYRIKFQKKKK